MEVTVIIPTYNGAHKVVHTLHALEEQTFQNFHTLVVVDGSTDNTIARIEATRWQLHSLQIIYQANGGRAKVRNRGAEEVDSGLIIFFDDDMRPTKSCLAAHVFHHQHHNHTIAVGTQINDWERAGTEIQRYRCHNSRRWERKLNENTSGAAKKLNRHQLHITGANFSLSYDTFCQLNGFDERLTDMEDYDLAVRANEAKIPIYYVPTAHAWHDETCSLSEYIDRKKDYVRAHYRLVQLKPTLYQKYPQRRIEPPQGIKRIVVWLFSHPVWVSLVDQLPRWSWLPDQWKYKIIDLIVASAVIRFARKLSA